MNAVDAVLYLLAFLIGYSSCEIKWRRTMKIAYKRIHEIDNQLDQKIAQHKENQEKKP